MAVDLNQLRDMVLENQRNSTSLPSNPNRQVLVNKDGWIITAADARPGELTTLVPQETFAR